MSLLTLPNGLSLARVALIPPILWTILHGPGWAAMGLFCLAVLTDVLDGVAARRRRQVSRLGTLLDHAADAVFVTALAAMGARLGLLPPLLPPLIAIAFIQYVLDSRVVQGSGLRRSRIGRCNGIAYFVVAGLAIAVHHHATDPIFVSTLRALGWLLVATTLVSMAQRAIYYLRAPDAP